MLDGERAPPRRPRPRPQHRDRRSRRPRCEFALPARTSACAAASRAPAKDFVAWVYADPDGPEHNTLNCSISDLELTVERDGAEHAAAHRPPARAAYEIGMRETDHGIPLQPYPDGEPAPAAPS